MADQFHDILGSYRGAEVGNPAEGKAERLLRVPEIPVGDLRTAGGDDVFLPHFLGGSDTGDIPEARNDGLYRTNYDLFLSRWGSVPGVIRLSGYLGTFGVALATNATFPEDMLAALRRLVDNPALEMG